MTYRNKTVFKKKKKTGGLKLPYFKIYYKAIDIKGTSQVMLVVRNLPTNAGDVRDVGLIPG